MSDTTVVRLRPEQVAHAFLTPRPPPQRRPLVLNGGEALRISTPEGEIALQRAGSGPAVLLLHGWEGQASDLAAFAPPLLDAGFSVLAMDLPAHGDSAGRQTSIPQSARALRAVGEALGPLHAVIAHSIGSAVLAEALHAGLGAQCAVLVSAPAHYEHHARRFAAAAGLDREGTEAMLALLRSAIGVEVREISLPLRAPQLRQRALFIHSADDRVVAIEDSLAGASVWPGARHLCVEGLGHRRLLGNPAVVAAAMDFVAISPERGTR
ncbi:alpha/beta fold hydrolase [Variovorax ginsengisoli]|uniref:Alpha/beta hydrolase n=1 Tax=Variovorax ginsengisoli TaxID=363844 RepID=A0ABT8SGH4_9BURK|nr:alpha/beta hydrolase [Variovorax ginsengisoli]MDN8617416.1 alpha/beta hydrolase [Variovorax ginsengisoli]MDO1536586.1 alpha/beta hydrolase [Variovorax ginsengisoli]